VTFDPRRDWPALAAPEKLVVIDAEAPVAVLVGRYTAADGKRDAPIPSLVDRWKALTDSQEGLRSWGINCIGTVWTLREGLDRILRNLAVNPHIRHLVMVGQDSKVFHPLEGMRAVLANGVDDANRIRPLADQDENVSKVFERDSLKVEPAVLELVRTRAGEWSDFLIDLRTAGRRDEEMHAALGDWCGASRPQRLAAAPPYDFEAAEIDVTKWATSRRKLGSGEPAPDVSRIGPCSFGVVEVEDGSGGRIVCLQARHDGGAVVTAKMETSTEPGSVLALRKLMSGVEASLWQAIDDVAELLVKVGLMAGAAERAAEAIRSPGLPVCGALPRRDGAGSRPNEALSAGKLELDSKVYLNLETDVVRGAVLVDCFAVGSGELLEAVEVQHVHRPGGVVRATVEHFAGSLDPDRAVALDHVLFLAVQLARAEMSVETGLCFQSEKLLTEEGRRNVDHHLVVGQHYRGTLAEVWPAALRGLHDEGLITITHKGRVAEAWCTQLHVPDAGGVLPPEALETDEIGVANYRRQLLDPATDLSADEYTYGDRQRHYFGGRDHPIDQLAEVVSFLEENPSRFATTQRWDPARDLRGSHGPCLALDVWGLRGGRLCTWQIARSHDYWGGLPMNVLGVAGAWLQPQAERLGVPAGSLTFLSISNNFRIEDDAEKVRKLIGGHLAAARERAKEDEGPGRGGFELRTYVAGALAGRCRAVEGEALPWSASADGGYDWSADPADLRARLREFRGTDQWDLAAAHVSKAVSDAERRRRASKALMLTHDPVDGVGVDHPLLALQLRNQLEDAAGGDAFVHGCGVLVSEPTHPVDLAAWGTHLTGLLASFCRDVARAAGRPVRPGAMTLAVLHNDNAVEGQTR
jgi:hypothetical protein